MKKPSRQHDELQTARSDMKKAAEKYAARYWEEEAMWPVGGTSKAAFLAGVRWERRRRRREGC